MADRRNPRAGQGGPGRAGRGRCGLRSQLLPQAAGALHGTGRCLHCSCMPHPSLGGTHWWHARPPGHPGPSGPRPGCCALRRCRCRCWRRRRRRVRRAGARWRPAPRARSRGRRAASRPRPRRLWRTPSLPPRSAHPPAQRRRLRRATAPPTRPGGRRRPPAAPPRQTGGARAARGAAWAAPGASRPRTQTRRTLPGPGMRGARRCGRRRRERHHGRPRRARWLGASSGARCRPERSGGEAQGRVWGGCAAGACPRWLRPPPPKPGTPCELACPCKQGAHVCGGPGLR